VGLELLLRLVERWRARPAERGSAFQAFRARVGEREVTLLAPLTFMNRSGEGIAGYERTADCTVVPAEALVLCDDVYLPVGALRLRARGSTGGHQGLHSVERHFGTAEYARLRIGVGEAASEALPDHVLSRFTSEEREAVEETLERAEDAAETWVREGVDAAMNRFNRRGKEESS
jgi:PTH1 family peptidyl-tRNA hydrolase